MQTQTLLKWLFLACDALETQQLTDFSGGELQRAGALGDDEKGNSFERGVLIGVRLAELWVWFSCLFPGILCMI